MYWGQSFPVGMGKILILSALRVAAQAWAARALWASWLWLQADLTMYPQMQHDITVFCVHHNIKKEEAPISAYSRYSLMLFSLLNWILQLKSVVLEQEFLTSELWIEFRGSLIMAREKKKLFSHFFNWNLAFSSIINLNNKPL